MKGVILVVFDGLGISLPGPGNAYFTVDPKNFESFKEKYPHTQLKASGEAVGMPANEVGNTEVGHINIAAGRVVYQSLPRIDLSIADGSFFDNKVLTDAIFHAKNNQSKLHLIGLLGEGTVHASTSHLNALLYLCREKGFENVFIHLIGDGRDSPPKAMEKYVKELEYKMEELRIGKIATVMGRYYGMDRDRRWDRVEKAYNCLTLGEGEKATSWREAVNKSYEAGKSDEFIEPTNITTESDQPVALIENNDAIVFYNFRIDRPRELTKAFVLDNFEQEANKKEYVFRHERDQGKTLPQMSASHNPPFSRKMKLSNLYFATMTEYEKGLPVHVAFPPHHIRKTLGEVISEKGLSQLRVAESEKERFVTKYFNGLISEPFPNEDRVILSSPNVPTYDQKPEMAAYEITDKVLENIQTGKYAFILINYANADMVGHTGNFQAAEQAMRVIDECVGKLADAANANDYTLLITADHGNIEEMLNPSSGAASTEHSGNPVPFIAINTHLKEKPVELAPGILADIAPTVLKLLNIPKPIEMTGRNLLEGLNERQSS